MFSGIIQGMVPVVEMQRQPGLLRLVIDLGDLARELKHGASVSVAGVCLTVVDQQGTRVSFDVIEETLQKTALGDLTVGDLVNVERSLRVGDEIGGHRVSGHVTGTAIVRSIEISSQQHVFTFEVDPTWMEYILPKGFIALNGCSLTVVNTGADWFTVHFIPETLRATTFGHVKKGERVHLELDAETQAIVTAVRRFLSHE